MISIIGKWISFQLFFDKSVLSNDVKATTFETNDTKLDVPVVTLSSQNHVKLLQQLKSGFKRRTNSNKYQIKSNNSCAKAIFKSFNWSKFLRSK